VYFPAGLIADAQHISNMASANILWGTKGPNAELQLANLLGGARAKVSEHKQLAMLRVGAYVIREIASQTLWQRASCCFAAKPRATPWEPHNSAPQPSAADSTTSGGGGTPPDVDSDSDTSSVCDILSPYDAGVLQRAIAGTTLSEQAGAHVSGDVLVSTVVPESSTVQSPEEDQAIAKITSHAVLEGGAPIGERTAMSRFPVIADAEVSLLNNHPTNLAAANALRNTGVGHHQPMPAEEDARDAVVTALKQHLYTEANINKAVKAFNHYLEHLPSKMSMNTRERVYHNVMNEQHISFLEYSTMVKAFIKSETSNKKAKNQKGETTAKPRPVADHGVERLVPVAKVIWVFEYIMKLVKNSNIKGRSKDVALAELFKGFGNVKNKSLLFAIDQTAFEFGICGKLKEMEVDVLKHIASHLRLDGLEMAFDRIVDVRTKEATWVMSFKDGAGARCKITIKLPRAMRESGDRMTSSGNWFENLVSWFSFLCSARSMNESIRRWVISGGRNFFYESARDGKEYLARVGWEGDDTAGMLEENITAEELCVFFKRWGWKAKVDQVKLEGPDYLEFVGERALMRDGKPVFVKDAECGERLVSAPPIKRLLQEKAWTTTNMQPNEVPATLKMYAIRLGTQFRSVPPIYQFAKAMYDDNKNGVPNKVNEAALRDIEMSLGPGGIVELQHFPEPDFSNEEIWREWAHVSAGECTDLEWSMMTGLTTLKSHGFDLQAVIPAAWRSAE